MSGCRAESIAAPTASSRVRPRAGAIFERAVAIFARVAQGDGAVIHAIKVLDVRQPPDAGSDRRDLEAFLDAVQPGWRDVAVHERFLPHMQASSVLPMAASGGLGSRPRARSADVSNVYFAGDWVGPRGFLIDASLDSARACAADVLARVTSRALVVPRAA